MQHNAPQLARDRRIAERRAQRKEEREYARKEEYARRCRAQVRVRGWLLNSRAKLIVAKL